MKAAIVLGLLCLSFPTYADDLHGNHGEGHETWHGSFYEKLVTPDTKVSCCNLTDCRPTNGRQHNGNNEVEINGKFVQVLPNKIVKKTAPDWGYHVCAPANFDGKPEHVYCVVLPPEN